ncbi:hypothetical protein Asulf_01179 [Archaeoglobus sulfaticallidus PM70-1]|uniref:Arc-like DNA binding domain-containing protein n=1 Tax=Archaeoglobus sulfaticallidus PM70-1 TaxID=387631 RepID=N0BDU5_9EURY|nr:hypothetical protein [Archaeoglobus sulfaticallidus]AGK61178.1 hypothetical protein Asulf_01179 [Archaeoglobus sulfaticallidus PM70-1]
MNDKKKKLIIKVELDGEYIDRFNAVKERAGVSMNAEVVRFLINYYYKNEVEGGLKKEIEKILEEVVEEKLRQKGVIP